MSARYLVGCDGVYSGVRTAAGIGFPGDAPQQLVAIADVRLNPGSGDAVAQEDTTFFLSPRGMLLVSPSPAANTGSSPRRRELPRPPRPTSNNCLSTADHAPTTSG